MWVAGGTYVCDYMGSSGFGVIGSCELPNMNAGDWNWVLCKSSKWSLLSRHFSILGIQKFGAYILPMSCLSFPVGEFSIHIWPSILQIETTLIYYLSFPESGILMQFSRGSAQCISQFQSMRLLSGTQIWDPIPSSMAKLASSYLWNLQWVVSSRPGEHHWTSGHLLRFTWLV